MFRFSSKDKLDKQLPYLKVPKLSSFSNVDDIKTLTGKDEDEILETKYLYDLESSIFINNENKFVKYALPPSAQLSSIEDIKFLNNSNDLIYLEIIVNMLLNLDFLVLTQVGCC